MSGSASQEKHQVADKMQRVCEGAFTFTAKFDLDTAHPCSFSIVLGAESGERSLSGKLRYCRLKLALPPPFYPPTRALIVAMSARLIPSSSRSAAEALPLDSSEAMRAHGAS